MMLKMNYTKSFDILFNIIGDSLLENATQNEINEIVDSINSNDKLTDNLK